MYLRLLNGEENHAKEVAGRLKEKENMIYEMINNYLRIKSEGCWFGSILVEVQDERFMRLTLFFRRIKLRMFAVIEHGVST